MRNVTSVGKESESGPSTPLRSAQDDGILAAAKSNRSGPGQLVKKFDRLRESTAKTSLDLKPRVPDSAAGGQPQALSWKNSGGQPAHPFSRRPKLTERKAGSVNTR
jgi:hypothetical protein